MKNGLNFLILLWIHHDSIIVECPACNCNSFLQFAIPAKNKKNSRLGMRKYPGTNNPHFFLSTAGCPGKVGHFTIFVSIILSVTLFASIARVEPHVV